MLKWVARYKGIIGEKRMNEVNERDFLTNVHSELQKGNAITSVLEASRSHDYIGLTIKDISYI